MEAVSGTPEYQSRSQKPVRDAAVAAVSFLFVFTSFQALQNLQTSLHQRQGLGGSSLAVMYMTSGLVSVATPALVYHVGVKRTILAAWMGHAVYVVCNVRPLLASLVPASLLLGLLTCPLFTAINTYLAALANKQVELDYAQSPRLLTTVHASFSKLTGTFHLISLSSQILGNLVCSLLLCRSAYNHLPGFIVYPETSHCGAGYCPTAGQGIPLALPQNFVLYIILGVFLVFDLIGIVVTWRFLPNLEQPRYTGREVVRKLRSYWSAYRQPKFWMLIPVYLNKGAVFYVHIGLFTEAYVGCALGLRMIGYVMALWGLSTMLWAGALGHAARHTGRPFLLGLAFLLEAAILAVFLWWRPHSGSTLVFVCLAAVMGLADGVWNVQCDALVAVLFPATVDSVFAACETWYCFAIATSFLLGRVLCPRHRLYVALSVLGTALLGYIVLEVIHRRSLRSFERGEQGYSLVNNAEAIALDEMREEEEEEETVFAADDPSSKRIRTANGNQKQNHGGDTETTERGVHVLSSANGEVVGSSRGANSQAAGEDDVSDSEL